MSILKVKIPIQCMNKRITDKIENAMIKAKEEAEESNQDVEVQVEIATNEYSIREMVIYGENVYNLILSPYSSDGIEFDHTMLLIKGLDEDWISPEDVSTLDKLITSTIEKYEKSKIK